MLSTSGQDGLELSSTIGWGHFSRPSRLFSSSSTIWVFCSVRVSSTTDTIFLPWRNSSFSSILYCSACLPPKHHQSPVPSSLYLQICLCVGKMHFHVTLLKQTAPHCASSALWSCLEQEIYVFLYWKTEANCLTIFKGTSVYLPDSDHCGCLTCFKRQTLVQIENKKWFKLSVVLDWQTHSPCSNLALLPRQWRAILIVPLWWHTGASLKCCNCSCPLPWKGG